MLSFIQYVESYYKETRPWFNLKHNALLEWKEGIKNKVELFIQYVSIYYLIEYSFYGIKNWRMIKFWVG